MRDRDQLEAVLRRIDGRPYPAYRDLSGAWTLGDLTLHVDRVQGDPYAAPSRLRLISQPIVDPKRVRSPETRLAAEDWLLRASTRRLRGANRGSGRSGAIELYRPGPEIVERSAVRVLPSGRIELRFRAGLPARGRRILAREARFMLFDDLLPAVLGLQIDASFDAHLDSVTRQRALRRGLEAARLVAFVANGSILPRQSGVDPRPMRDAVPFRSPPSLEHTLDTRQGPVTGMGIPEGVTLITGGGFHGKSTLLQALQSGHLDHVPGDGREQVVSRPEVVKIRAEDGRSVVNVDISPFLRDLPGGRSTSPFSTADASGSTSQAAAIVEAVEAGARVLLLDEDTSATNLLVRDARMRELIPRDREPITPFVERVRQLYDTWNVSTIMVVGGVGDYLSVADRVVVMDHYHPRDVTDRARELAGAPPSAPSDLPAITPRIPLRAGLRPGKLRARDARHLRYGDEDIDLVAIEQLVDRAHALSIGEAMRLLHDELVDGQRTLPQLLDAMDAILDDEGVEVLSPWNEPPGDLLRPRRHELAAVLNRLRSLQIRNTT